MSLVFVDTETTGLDPDRHEVWEIAYAVDDGPVQSALVPHVGASVDPRAAAVNGYYERAPLFTGAIPSGRMDGDLRAALDGNTLVGANPAFDAAFLRTRWGVTPWKYRLWDVEAYAAGVLDLPEPKGLAYISDTLRGMGHMVPEPDHSAAADVAALRACFAALRALAVRPCPAPCRNPAHVHRVRFQERV